MTEREPGGRETARAPVLPAREHRVLEGTLVVPAGAKFTLVASRFNSFIVEPLVAWALDALARRGAAMANVAVVRGPGAWEMPLAALKIAQAGGVDAIIALGCVIRGATPHFDYVAGPTGQGVGAGGGHTRG